MPAKRAQEPVMHSIQERVITATLGGIVTLVIALGAFLLNVRDFTVRANEFVLKDVQAQVDNRQDLHLELLQDQTNRTDAKLDAILNHFKIPQPKE